MSHKGFVLKSAHCVQKHFSLSVFTV